MKNGIEDGDSSIVEIEHTTHLWPPHTPNIESDWRGGGGGEGVGMAWLGGDVGLQFVDRRITTTMS